MKKALITQRQMTDRYGCQTDVLEAAYAEFFNGFDICLFPISNFIKDCAAFFQCVDPDIVILTGGGSLPAEYYKEDYHYELQSDRDRTEKFIIEKAIDEQIPIIAICRGMQFINGYFGGKISKLSDLKVPRKNNECHPLKNLKTSEIFCVNNFHNDGIFADDLCVNAVPLAIDEENNVIEAYEIPDKKILALQWHPERNFEAAAMKKYSSDFLIEYLETLWR